MKALLVIGILGCIVFSGCETPAQIVSDPNTISAIEATAEGAVGLTQTLGILWPALIPIGTAGAGILAAYKRLKPKIREARAESNKYHAGGEMLAEILEDIKTNHPILWKRIGPKIKEASSLSDDIKSAIDGFRGK